jgi:hypothetical protein
MYKRRLGKTEETFRGYTKYMETSMDGEDKNR